MILCKRLEPMTVFNSCRWVMLWSMLYKERRYSRAKCAAKRGKKKEKGKNMIPGGIEPPTSCEDIPLNVRQVWWPTPSRDHCWNIGRPRSISAVSCDGSLPSSFECFTSRYLAVSFMTFENIFWTPNWPIITRSMPGLVDRLLLMALKGGRRPWRILLSCLGELDYFAQQSTETI